MMTADDKLAMVKTLMGIPESDASADDQLEVYIASAGREIISWRYSYCDEKPDEVPGDYEMTQIWAVINGYSQSGADGQITHSENGVYRTFSYTDMLHYIRKNVIHKVGLL